MQKPWYRDPWHWVAFALLGAIVLMVASLLPWGLWKSEVIAAWVQAVGSIGAIVGAVWLGNLQHAREIARREFEAWQAARAPVLDARGLLRAAQFDVSKFIRTARVTLTKM